MNKIMQKQLPLLRIFAPKGLLALALWWQRTFTCFSKNSALPFQKLSFSKNSGLKIALHESTSVPLFLSRFPLFARQKYLS